MLVILQEHPVIRAVVKYQHRLTETVEQFKVVAELIDGSFLVSIQQLLWNTENHGVDTETTEIL